jgi:competence protein ComGC
LLLVFAMAVTREEEAPEVDEKTKAVLLRAGAIAFRSALVAGLVGVLKTFGTSDAMTELAAACRQNFVPSVANLEAPDGIQLLSVSLLLIVFALAVREDSTEQNEETESKVDLVRTDAIAFRFSVAAALLGSLKTFGGVWSVLAQILPAGPPEGFTPAIVSLEAAEGIQLLSVSVLLLTFAVAVISEEDESENESEKTSKVELVCAPAIAFRAALTAGFLGLIKMLPASPVEGFNPAVVSLEAPEGIQLLCISVLLLVLALAISTDNIDSQEQSSFDSWVKLVKVDAIAFRSALFAGVVGVFKTFGNPHARAELASMNQAEFSSDVAILEAPEGLQLLCVALLLFVFVAAVNSEDTSKDKSEAKTKSTRMLDLVRPPTIAFRMAMVAGLIGSLMSIDSGIVSLPRVAATGEIALVLGTGVAVMLSDVPRLVSV